MKCTPDHNALMWACVVFESKARIHTLPRSSPETFAKVVRTQRQSIEDDPRSRRPLASTTEHNIQQSQQWKLLHDNAPTHKANFVMDYSTKHSVVVLSHPPYSPDLYPCEYFYFSNLKLALKGRRFSLSKEVIENATAELNKLRKMYCETALKQLFDIYKKCFLILLSFILISSLFASDAKSWNRWLFVHSQLVKLTLWRFSQVLALPIMFIAAYRAIMYPVVEGSDLFERFNPLASILGSIILREIYLGTPGTAFISNETGRLAAPQSLAVRYPPAGHVVCGGSELTIEPVRSRVVALAQ
ncbi:hypothetical protein LAZ67_15000188 [Cordylochernes scorpioides]|uniref:Tc1-like transposase DDE domain-containing protein n=1 Tax=Cordylochernes scorpioides TaxID=51811 RepID=A0ABY6L7T9_9ARAC|nr:hypothetical protein LAZ67_15000188 [Cordylochernes scorpioides]